MTVSRSKVPATLPVHSKQARLLRFGGPEIIEVAQVMVPAPKRSQLRIRTRAASLNPIDGKIRRGELKFISGSKFPMAMGLELSGVVEAVGEGVQKFRVGDEVVAFASMDSGAMGEFALVEEAKAVHKSKSVSFVHAACCMVSLTALQALRDVAQVKAGMRVLINGASGGVGVAAVQLAKQMGVQVTATATGRAIDVVKTLGADEVIDYRQDVALHSKGLFDVVLDLALTLPFSSSRSLLTPRGIHVDPAPGPQKMLSSMLQNPFRRQKAKFVMGKFDGADISTLLHTVEDGVLAVLVEATYSLDQIQTAYRRLEAGGVLGKVAIEFETGTVGTAVNV
jgi:NADPH:quinone reductase-like Zn-dependent oxidoreductase